MNRVKFLVIAAASLFAIICWYHTNNGTNEASCFSSSIDTDLKFIVSGAQVYPCSTDELLQFGSNHFPRVICALQDGSYPDKKKSRQYRKMSRLIADEVGYPLAYQRSLALSDTNTEALSAFAVETSGLPVVYFSLKNFRDVYQQWKFEGCVDIEKQFDHFIAVATVRQLEVAADELTRNRATQTAAQ